MMDHSFCPKRTLDESFDKTLCIICLYERKSDNPRESTVHGREKIRDAASSRKKLRDTEYRETIVRLEHALGSDPESMIWHKSCYAQFTDKSKIDRLRKKRDRESCCETRAITSAERSVPRHLRRDFVPIK